MNTSRGFVSLGLVLLVIIGLTVVVGTGWWATRNVPTALNQAPNETATTTPAIPAGWESYHSDLGINFAYPPEYSKPKEFVGEMISLSGSDEERIDVVRQPSVGRGCHYGYCDAATIKQLKVGTLVWDDVGEPSGVETNPATRYEGWRAVFGKCNYYVVFFNETRQTEFLSHLTLEQGSC